MFTCELLALYMPHVCTYVHIRMFMFALDAEPVEWDTESSPSHLAAVLIGCALLTGCWQSTSHRQVLCFSPFHLQGLWENISSVEFPAPLISSMEKKEKKEPLSGAFWQVTKLVFFSVAFGYRRKEGREWEAGDRSGLMRRFPASYQAWVVYCSVTCLARECMWVFHVSEREREREENTNALTEVCLHKLAFIQTLHSSKFFMLYLFHIIYTMINITLSLLLELICWVYIDTKNNSLYVQCELVKDWYCPVLIRFTLKMQVVSVIKSTSTHPSTCLAQAFWLTAKTTVRQGKEGEGT